MTFRSKIRLKKNLDLFKRSVGIYVKKFGLTHLDVGVALGESKRTNSWLDPKDWDDQDSHMIITVSKSFLSDKGVDSREIRETSLHEVLEILLWKLSSYVLENKKETKQMDNLRHEVINRIIYSFEDIELIK